MKLAIKIFCIGLFMSAAYLMRDNLNYFCAVFLMIVGAQINDLIS